MATANPEAFANDNSDAPASRLSPETQAVIAEVHRTCARVDANIAAIRAQPPSVQMAILRAAGLMEPESPEWALAKSRRMMRALFAAPLVQLPPTETE